MIYNAQRVCKFSKQQRCKSAKSLVSVSNVIKSPEHQRCLSALRSKRAIRSSKVLKKL